MNYYYDLKLNFADDNLMFYEWDNDEVEHFKKIPLFQVNTKTLKDFINNDIVVNQEFLEVIKYKAKGKDIDYVALFADKNGAIALEFDAEGNSISRSFLNVYDELNLLDVIYTLKIDKIDYSIKNEVAFRSDLKQEERIKLLINTEVNNLVESKDFCKLKYLFMEWFNKEPNNNDEMIVKIHDALKNKVGPKELKVYNLIKLSYSNV